MSYTWTDWVDGGEPYVTYAICNKCKSEEGIIESHGNGKIRQSLCSFIKPQAFKKTSYSANIAVTRLRQTIYTDRGAYNGQKK